MRDSDKIAVQEMGRIMCKPPSPFATDTAEDILNWCYLAVKFAERLYLAGYRKQSGWISADNPPETYRDEYEELIPFLVCCNGTKYPFRALYDGTNWGDGIGRLDAPAISARDERSMT